MKVSTVALSSLLAATGVPLAATIPTNELGDSAGPCDSDTTGKPCGPIDGYVGSSVIFEDESVRIWNFTLAPGESTSLHRHDYDYHFVAIAPTQLKVWGEDGSRLFDFRAEGVLAFNVVGDYLEPVGIELPFKVPRVHVAKNIGDSVYNEIIFESKIPANPTCSGSETQ